MHNAKADCAVHLTSPTEPSFFVTSEVVRHSGSADLVSLLRPKTWSPKTPGGSVDSFPVLEACIRNRLVAERETTFTLNLCQEQLQGQELVMYCMAVRNFFAMHYEKPPVGKTLYQALIDLHSVCERFLTDKHNNFLWRYVQSLKLDDCRNSLDLATQLLHFSEDTQWEKGYIESFVHCVGMVDRTETVSHPMFAPLTHATRHLLRNAHREQQEDVQHLEQLLAGFDIVGGNSTISQDHATRFRAAKAFQGFLREFCTAKYGQWPPSARHRGHWLTRSIALELQAALGTLYEYLVDQDICWARSFSPPGDQNTQRPTPAGRSVSGTASSTTGPSTSATPSAPGQPSSAGRSTSGAFGLANTPVRPPNLPQPSAGTRSVTMPVLPSSQPISSPLQQPREIIGLHYVLSNEQFLPTNAALIHSSKYPLMDLIHRWNKKCGFRILPHPFPRIPELRDTYTGSQA